MKKALAILGSPRKNGNTAKMLDIAMQSAKQAGYEITLFNLYETNIGWCRGCMACKASGICVIQDDAQLLREALIGCDLVLIASPTYFANVSAPVKNLFDRLVGAVMDDNSSMIPKPKLSRHQKYLLLTTCTTPFPFDRLGGQSTGTLRNMREVFHIAGMKSAGSVVFAGTHGKSEVPQRVKNKISRLINPA